MFICNHMAAILLIEYRSPINYPTLWLSLGDELLHVKRQFVSDSITAALKADKIVRS